MTANPKLNGLLKRYKDLNRKAAHIEKAGKPFERCMTDDDEFIYLAHVRAAGQLRQQADDLLDRAADKIAKSA